MASLHPFPPETSCEAPVVKPDELTIEPATLEDSETKRFKIIQIIKY